MPNASAPPAASVLLCTARPTPPLQTAAAEGVFCPICCKYVGSFGSTPARGPLPRPWFAFLLAPLATCLRHLSASPQLHPHGGHIRVTVHRLLHFHRESEKGREGEGEGEGGEGGRRQRGRRGRECLRECGLPQAGGHDVVLASCAAGLHHTTTARARVQEIPVLGRCQHLLCLRWLPPFNPGTPLNVLPLLAYDKKKSEFCIFFWRPHGLYRAPG